MEGHGCRDVQGTRRGLPQDYPGETDEQAADSAIGYGSDAFIAFSTWKWIEAHLKTGIPRLPLSLRTAGNAEQVPPRHIRFPLRRYRVCIWHSRYAAGWTPSAADRTLSDQMMTYWTKLRQDGRSQRAGSAAVAEVHRGRRLLAHSPGQHHHFWPGHAASALRIPAAGKAAVPLPIAVIRDSRQPRGPLRAALFRAPRIGIREGLRAPAVLLKCT